MSKKIEIWGEKLMVKTLKEPKDIVLALLYYIFIVGYSLFNEIIFSVSIGAGFSVYKVLFSVAIGLFLLAIGSLVNNKKIAFSIQAVFAVILNLVYISQLIYYSIFGTPYFVASLGGASKAFEFVEVALNALSIYWISYIIMLAQMVLLFTVYRKSFLKKSYIGVNKIIFSSVFLVVCGFSIVVPTYFTNGLNSPRYLLLNEFVPLSSIETFGVPMCMALDVKYAAFGAQAFEGTTDVNIVTQEESSLASSSQEPSPTPTATPEPTSTPEPIVYEEQVMDIVFNMEETNETYLAMNEFFSSRTPTMENEYTGMFEGKNLILITAEAFTPYFIDPELTPTLYKMMTEGFSFNNFYTPIWGVSTSDGEYVATTGLLPKSGVWSYTRAAENYMPFAFGNQFNNLGYESYAFHNHSYSYYNRHESYPTMGYEFYAKGYGMDIVDQWPESDIELITQSTPYFMDAESFNVYYMTVSGHLEYNFFGNMMAYKNQDAVEHIEASDAVKAYIACNLELEYAMAELVAQLEAAGKLEDTVIALSSDHYPYGLTDEQYAELRGIDTMDTTFEKYENAFILWNSEMEEPVVVDKIASSLDIAPTLSNLFGLEYDSRLYIGQDILSDSPSLVMFSDRSYITDKYMYNANTGEAIVFEGQTVTEEEVSAMSEQVSQLFLNSARILDMDYYGYLFN